MRIDEDPDGIPIGEAVRIVLRRNWLVAAAILANAILLVFVPSVWHTQVELGSRSGRASHISAAERDLILAGIGLALYSLPGIGTMYGYRMRPPTDGEITVARWLVRTLGAIAMWVAFYVTLP